MSDVHGKDGRRSVRVRIEGRVQGVGFRNWTQRMAGQLGLSGWVRNRSDGTVEAVFSGSGAAVGDALVRCKMGPRSAKVTRIAVTDIDPPAHSGFEILPGV